MAYLDENIQSLLQKYMEGNATAAEYQQLVEWLRIEWQSPAVEEVLLQQLESSSHHPAEEEINWPSMVQSILQKDEVEKEPAIIHSIQQAQEIRKFQWRWVAAAVIFLVLGSGAYFYFRTHKETELAKTQPFIPKDIRPGTDKAVLTLADGRQVILDNTAGTVANEKGIEVINQDGQLLYKDSLNNQKAVVSYHTVATPRGGQYQLILEDGTKVWLNAASSLRFPTAFPGKDRIVELTGEAYFEVAHNAQKPFHVKKGNVDVTVLGTHFNVNAYDDEETLKVTLLEGSVRVTAKNLSNPNRYQPTANSLTLKPGQQAVLTNSYQLSANSSVDLDQVMAWKEGIFLLDNTDLPTLMRQISRWYDVDVKFEGKIPVTRFGGGVSKDQPLSVILKTLERYGLQFELNGKSLVVK